MNSVLEKVIQYGVPVVTGAIGGTIAGLLTYKFSVKSSIDRMEKKLNTLVPDEEVKEEKK